MATIDILGIDNTTGKLRQFTGDDVVSVPVRKPVLAFNGVGCHVNHGQFWTSATTGLNSNRMYWDTWVKPLGSGYVISAGYGGAHELLLGFTGSGPYTVTGNVWDGAGSALRSFGSATQVAHGEWIHLAVGMKVTAGVYMITYINGIPMAATAFTGTRGVAGTSAADGILFVGGSHHLNFTGYIAAIRGFDTAHPTDWYHTIRPQFSFSGQMINHSSARINADFLADYTVPSSIIPDLSQGYGGLVHPGRLYNAGDNASPDFEIPSNANATLANRPYWVYDDSCPVTYNGTGLPPQYQRTISPTTPPGGVAVYDSFGRQDVLPAWTDTPNIGSTEVGSLAWTVFPNATYYIYNGQLHYTGTSVNSGGWVDTGTSNVSVKVTKPVGTSLANAPWNCGVLLRYVDNNNFWSASCIYESGVMNVAIRLRKAGSDSIVSGTNIGATAVSDMRLEANGNVYTLYVNNASVATYTDTNNDFISATKHGFACFNNMFWSINDIAITNL